MSRLIARLTIPLLLIASVWFSVNTKWSGQFWKYTVTSDGKGYYAYLPAAFIYGDFNYGFFDSIEAKYYDAHTKYDFRNYYEGKAIDKYFCGTALMQSPFFLGGHLAAKISGAETDGYSRPYMIAVCLGAIFWLGAGLFALRKYLLLHGASEEQAAFVIAIIYIGTNLFYYTVTEPMMSHVYSFALVSFFLLWGKRWIEGNDRAGIITAFLLGMIILVRPVNAMAACWLFFEAGSFRNLYRRKISFLQKPSGAIAALLLLLLPLSLQPVVYKLQTGHFFIDAYGEEGFRFTHPELINFLFSYKKGLFLYLPLTLVAVFGIYPAWKKDRSRGLIAAGFFLLVVYVLSSWWMWYYGGSFGTRVIVEYLPVFALLLLFLLRHPKSPAMQTGLICLLLVITVFCQLQTWQYRYEIIHWSDMTQEKYWDVFLQFRK